MTERNSISGRPIPAGMAETTSQDSGAGVAVKVAADAIGQVMAAVSALLDLDKGATPHVFACALGHVIGRVVANPAHGPAILAFAETDLTGFADTVAAQVRENILLTVEQAKAQGGPDDPDTLRAIREAAARAAAGQPLN